MVLNINFYILTVFCLVALISQVFFGKTVVLGAELAIAGVFFIYLKRKKILTMADVVFICGWLLNVCYVAFSFGNVRQYDYYNFLMYADFFVKHDFFINHWQNYIEAVYFHPPLWGFLSAFVAKMVMFAGKTQEFGFDCSRFISLWAVGGGYIIFWRFMQKLKYQEFVQIWLFGIFVFAPINGIIANLVNNDALVYFFMLGGIYKAYLWFLRRTYASVSGVCAFIFLAGMTKFSGLMIMPFVAVLGLFWFLFAQDKADKNMWGQFFLIALSFVLGFAWGLFLLYYHFPLVPPLVNADFQNMSGYTLSERLFSVSAVGVPFADIWGNNLEPNVWLALIKTSLFGEWSWRSLFWAYVQYGLGIFWAFCAVGLFFYIPKYKIANSFPLSAAVITLVFSVLSAWINFWLDYPYFCSSEFRYVIILLPLSLLWIGGYLDKKSLPKLFKGILTGLLAIMVFARFMLYLNTI